MSGGVRLSVVSSLLMLAVSACGPEYVRSEPSEPEAQVQSSSAIVNTGKKKLLPALGDRTVTELQPRSHPLVTRPALTVSATGIAVADGTPIQAVMGVMGCGFMETGRGASVVTAGAAQIVLPSDQPIGYGGTLLVFVDNDHNGKCDVAAGDQLWETPLTTTQLPGSMSIDFSTLEPGSAWACNLFAQPQ